MKYYRELNGTRHGLFQITAEEQELLLWLLSEYNANIGRSWMRFQQRTAYAVIETAKKKLGDKWLEHPLYKIQLDMVTRVRIASGELHHDGELSDMLVEGEASSRSKPRGTRINKNNNYL